MTTGPWPVCEPSEGCSLVGLVRCVVGLEETDSHRRHRTQEESDCQRDNAPLHVDHARPFFHAKGDAAQPTDGSRGEEIQQAQAAGQEVDRAAALEPGQFHGALRRTANAVPRTGSEGNDVDVISRSKSVSLSHAPPANTNQSQRAPPDTSDQMPLNSLRMLELGPLGGIRSASVGLLGARVLVSS